MQPHKLKDFNERYKEMYGQGYQDQLVQCARERSGGAGTPPPEGRHSAGVDPQGQSDFESVEQYA